MLIKKKKFRYQMCSDISTKFCKLLCKNYDAGILFRVMKEAVDGIFKFLTRLCFPLIIQMLSNGSFLPLKQILVLHSGFSYVFFRMCGTSLYSHSSRVTKEYFYFLFSYFRYKLCSYYTRTSYPT